MVYKDKITATILTHEYYQISVFVFEDIDSVQLLTFMISEWMVSLFPPDLGKEF